MNNKWNEIIYDALKSDESFIGIENIGSTSIPGMPGMATIDLTLTFKKFPITEDHIRKIKNIGFKDDLPHNDKFIKMGEHWF